MSEPITWRSVSAPNFGASAALLNSGGEALNQGITSLAAVAKGYADEQKGIAVSNAVADLSNTTNDADRMAAFTAHSANLKDHGIDLKDLIAANQAQHKTLQGDATFKSDQELSASNLESKVLEQANQKIKNKTDQGALDYQATEQEQKTGTYNQGILESNSSIKASDASVNSSNASAKNSNDAISERALARLEKTKLDNDTTLLLKMSQDPKYANPDGSANMGMLTKDLQAAGVPLKNIVAGMGGVDTLGRREELKAAASLLKANQEKRDFEATKQDLADASKSRFDARDALIASQDTDIPWFEGGQDEQKIAGAAAISSAFAATVKDPSGKDVSFSPSDITRFVSESSDSGDLDNSGDLDIVKFNERLKREAAAIHTGVPVEEMIKAIRRSPNDFSRAVARLPKEK